MKDDGLFATGASVVARASISPRDRAEAQMGAYVEAQVRRTRSVPPGTCPVVFQEVLMRSAAAQTCGKCVPCRDGLPQLARYLGCVAACEATARDLGDMRALAQMVRDTSDCVIGSEAARVLLAALDDFADEFASHVEAGVCGEGAGQTLPCETLCPAHVDVPAYVALVEEGDYAAAVNTVRKDNPFPTACAYVCEHPCEQRCRRSLIDAPVNIRGIKRYAVDHAPADTVEPFPRGTDTGRSIAVIGGGPSGLTCAYFLALMGHRVTVFEGRAQLGGMLRYGIPAYRLPRERLDEDICGILSVGSITARCNERVGVREMADIAETYDAVYVAIGAQEGKRLRIDGADARGVVSAVDLLGRIGDGDYPDFTGKKVVVVGGGNVAMDCARTSVRAGAAEVSVVYRRRKDDMTALVAEVEAAIAEGVEMMVLESPEAIEQDGEGNCTALITQPQMIGAVRGGRPSPVAADKPCRRIEADVVLVAVGQGVVAAPFEEFGLKTTRGCFDANDQLAAVCAEGAPDRSRVGGIFVGGDCQTGPSSAIRAVAAGRVAACSIDEYLGYHHGISCEVPVPAAFVRDHAPKGRVELAERPARERAHDFFDVECGMSREEVIQECGRCLRCDHFGCGVLEGGRQRYA